MMEEIECKLEQICSGVEHWRDNVSRKPFFFENETVSGALGLWTRWNHKQIKTKLIKMANVVSYLINLL